MKTRRRVASCNQQDDIKYIFAIPVEVIKVQINTQHTDCSTNDCSTANASNYIAYKVTRSND